MKSYWLYLDSYTFIFSGKQGYLFYNTLSGHNFIIENGVLDQFIVQLIDPQNMYCISITDKDLRSVSLRNFIQFIRKSYVGDIIEKKMTSKMPIALYPKALLMKSIEKLETVSGHSSGEDIINYIHEISIHINGLCGLNCSLCNFAFNQVKSCTKTLEELSIDNLKKILYEINGSSINEINISGGNIFQYSKWENLYDILNNTRFKVNLYSHYKNIFINKPLLSFLDAEKIKLRILVPGCFDKVQILATLQVINELKLHFEIFFYISEVAEYEKAEDFCVKNKISHYSLNPIYTKTNLKFFEENVYLDVDDILSIPASKRDIFARKALNQLEFGKITIMPNGDVFANKNMPKIGNVFSMSIHEIVLKELKEGNSWLRIRCWEPCTSCVYQWLCPSPSNYEYVIGKPNLCHIA